MNNVDELFHQNMTEFLQTKIDGSVLFFWMQSPFSHLKNTWRLFILFHWTLIKYLPFGIKFFPIQNQVTLSLKKHGILQAKQQLFLFQSSRQCFISVLRNIDFLNQLWSCYSSFTFKSNLLHMIIRYFPGINQSSLSSVFVVGKKILLQNCLGNFYSWHPWLFLIVCKHYQSSISPVNDSPLVLKNMPVLFTLS